jgi:glycosyltransferase involved in cell wall biosynthesis
MKTKIYYLTRSYYPYQKGGGPLMRTGAVKYLKELGWDVTVVMPNYKNKEYKIEDDIWQIPFKSKHIQKLASLFERVGIYEDYLDKWVDYAYEYLKDKMSKDDIVFSTSGGELGMIKLGSLLRDKTDCKFVANFRDPLNYGYMNGLRRDKKPHIGREKAHEKYMQNADLIITSSQYYADVLKKRFSNLADRIHNNYFGYIKEIDLSQYKKQPSDKLRIAYAGMMSNTQKPELLYEAYKKLNSGDIELYFIGNIKNYKPLQCIEDKNVHFIDFLPHEEFLKFMCENIDVGFVSLVNDYYGACVPSKIYEYINLGLPMLGALPDGDGKEMINEFGFGLACSYDDIELLSRNIKVMTNQNELKKNEKNALDRKIEFSMAEKIKEVDQRLRYLNDSTCI